MQEVDRADCSALSLLWHNLIEAKDHFYVEVLAICICLHSMQAAFLMEGL